MLVVVERGPHDNRSKSDAVVRGARLELSAPSIHDALHDILLSDGITEVVCVP